MIYSPIMIFKWLKIICDRGTVMLDVICPRGEIIVVTSMINGGSWQVY